MRVRTFATVGLVFALAACSETRQAAPPPDEPPVAQPVAEEIEALDADCGCKRQPIRRLTNPITPKAE